MDEVFDYSALEGKIKQYYDTQENFAKNIPMSRVALKQKLQGNAYFTAKNIYKICELLYIEKEEIGNYFFTPKVTITKH